MSVQDNSPSSFLETPEGEISFFRSIMRARPVGMHRHFHVLAVRNAIQKDTGQSASINDIWEKLRRCYDLEILESQERDFDESSSSSTATPASKRSPSPSENLAGHPFFIQEYALPVDPSIEALVSSRRMRVTASPPSSPATSPSIRKAGSRKSKRRKSTADLAGLVGGDSESSALTQESGDEGSMAKESVATSTDRGTEYAENGLPALESSPEPATVKPTRSKASKPGKKTVATGRTKAAATNVTTGASTRLSRKRNKR